MRALTIAAAVLVAGCAGPVEPPEPVLASFRPACEADTDGRLRATPDVWEVAIRHCTATRYGAAHLAWQNTVYAIRYPAPFTLGRPGSATNPIMVQVMP